jgi:predicted NBD/HSP70 family sugar kinase/biotin operon repressor
MGSGARNTTRGLRRGNRAVLLRSLYHDGPVSRQQLSETTGLSSATVSTLIAELLAEGVVTEVGTRESDGGRPRILLSVDPGYGYAIGVDIGETRVQLELFDMRLNGLAKAEYGLVHDMHGPDLVTEHILDGLRSLVSDAGIDEEQILGVGVGVPGVVSRRPEPVVDAQTYGWKAVPLATLLRAGTTLPLHIENGAKTLGQAEMWFGAGHGAQHVIIALLGTGVGAAIVSDGSIYHGVSRGAGEWGHSVVERDGRPCRCGGRGCLEAYVGAAAILERFWEAEPSARRTESDEETSLAAMLTMAEDGNPAARQVLAETADWLGLAIANMINLFNPERFLLGGWTGRLLGATLPDEIRAAVRSRALASPFSQVTIGLGSLGPDAVTLGAATLVIDAFLERGDCDGTSPDRGRW